ncbi:Druantia anti-phage system protein DruA, partial [Desulfatitalea alkaliphila]
GRALRRLRADWRHAYGVDPWLVETFVDSRRFHGGCYRASNFIVLGQTSGRGRMDRNHQRHGAQVKTVMVHPLVKDARQRLTAGRAGE